MAYFKNHPFRYVAGADVAYDETTNRLVAGFTVLDSKNFKVMETATYEGAIPFAYVPGQFSRRELPPLLKAHKKLVLKPDLIICDGHGLAHPEENGLACQLGASLKVPTIGCAKRKLVGEYNNEKLKQASGASVPLVWKGKEVGKVLRTQKGINPLFVSVGHKITLEEACFWVLKMCTKYRLPETTRTVDHLVRKALRNGKVNG